MPAREVITEVTPENLQAAIAERDRMREVLDGYATGRVSRTQLPSDAHEYYGRLQKLEPQIEAAHADRGRAEEYDRQMTDAKQLGYDYARELAGYTNEANWSITGLRREAANSRHVIGLAAENVFDERDPKQSMLSADDVSYAYKLGANQAVQEWYFEQKRELQLGRKYMPEQSQDFDQNDFSTQPLSLRLRSAAEDIYGAARHVIAPESGVRFSGETREVITDSLAIRRADLEREAAETAAFSAVEAGAALNYLRGRFEEFNATREAFARQSPALEKDLPPTLQVDEIQVRQVTLEQERSEEKGLAMTMTSR